MENKLYRSRKERMIGGVAGGLGVYLQVDPVWIRLLFVALLFASGLGFWLYLIMWIIIPDEGRAGAVTGDSVHANVQDLADRAREFGQTVQRGLEGRQVGAGDGSTTGAIIVGGAFILLGIFLLLQRLNFFWWLNWGVMWPLLLILLGGALLFSRIRQ
jgi:phage shock protein PspC (stress-responsive transcriptional regulator)